MFKSIQSLPEAELTVMQALWQCSAPATRGEIETAMHPKRSMAATTLLTLLGRLEQRGFVRVEKDGKNNVYTPLVSRRDYQTSQSRRFLDRVFGGSVSAFANALSEGALSEEELKQLKSLLGEDQ